MAGNAIGLPYSFRVVVVDAKSIVKLVPMEHRREIIQHHVREFLQMMKKGETFQTPIVVNEVTMNGKTTWRILDGNHRMEAAKQLIQLWPTWPGIEVMFVIYKNLDEKQEAQAYDAWNSGKPSTLEHVLTVHQNEYPIYNALVGKTIAPKVRVVLKPSVVAGDIKFSSLLSAYTCRYQVNTLLSKRNEATLAELKQMSPVQTLQELNKFFVLFVKVFEPPGKHNPFSKGTAIGALWKIYAMNAERFGLAEIERGWRRVHDDKSIRNMICGYGPVKIGVSGSASTYMLAQEMVRVMNHRKSTNTTILPTANRMYPSQYKKKNQE